MKVRSRYIFSLVLLVISMTGYSQNPDDRSVQPTDTVNFNTDTLTLPVDTLQTPSDTIKSELSDRKQDISESDREIESVNDTLWIPNAIFTLPPHHVVYQKEVPKPQIEPESVRSKSDTIQVQDTLLIPSPPLDIPPTPIIYTRDSIVISEIPDAPRQVEIRIDTIQVQDTLLIPRPPLDIPPDPIPIIRDSVRITEVEIEPEPVELVAVTIQIQDTLLIPSPPLDIPANPIAIERDSVYYIEATVDSLSGKKRRKREKRSKIKQPRDSIIGPTGIEFAIDYGKLVTIPSDFETKLEAAVSYTLWEKLQLLFEYGYGKITPREAIKNGDYTSEGNYYRAGIAYGGEVLPKSYVYLGFMYGSSQFEDYGTVLIESQTWEDFNGTFNRTDLTAKWFEFVMITESELRKNLYWGSKWRLRRLREFTDQDYDPIVYSIPGYGRTFDNSIPAVNLYIKYRIVTRPEHVRPNRQRSATRR